MTPRWYCNAWGPPDHPALPKDWPMPPSCNLDHGHDGPHRGVFDIEWTDDDVSPNDGSEGTP